MKTKNYQLKTKNYRAGMAIMISVIFLMLISLVAVTGYVTPAVRETQVVRGTANSNKSYFLAEAAQEDAIYRIKTGKQYQSNYNFTIGGDTAAVNITTNGGEKTIQTDGVSADNYRKVQTKLAVSSAQADFHYGVQIGEGGLTMKQNSVVNGSLYSNGSIACSSNCTGTKILGDAWIAAAPAATADQQSTSAGSNFIVGKTVSSRDQWDAAQSFKPSADNAISKVSLYLRKVGSPGDATIRIIKDKSGEPGGSNDEKTSGTLAASTVTTSYGWIDVAFTSNPTLNGGSTYWIVLDASNNSSNYWEWGYATNNPYANGQGKYSKDWSVSNPTWNNVNASANSDLAFKTYMGGAPTSIDGLLVTGDAHANSILNSQVCGDAYYTTIDSTSYSFLNAPGSPCPTPYTPGTAHTPVADPPALAMPVSAANITAWEADAAAGGTIAGPYTPATGTHIGPKKITGNLNLDTNGATYYIDGPLWVVGDITMANNVKIVLNPSFGALSTVIIADDPANQSTVGKITANNGVDVCGSAGYNSGTNACNSSNGSYIMLISTYNGTGKAITVNNNVDGAIFYASAGKIEVENNATAKQITGYEVELENNASITYETGLANIQFSAGPSASFQINSWREVQ
ncbi:MAG: hypothetical protein HZA25_03300 [Candidatus Niyogibacteria bacterium]|nr:hypothetical protein [Candidatus Niyogibacteria bacterium]